MRKRKRYPLEWGGYPVEKGEEPVLWRANVAASNCYEGAKESVGFHTDQLTYLGPYPTIASLSLGKANLLDIINASSDTDYAGVNRIFRLREVIPTDEKDKRSARTFNIPLRHNSVGASIPIHRPPSHPSAHSSSSCTRRRKKYSNTVSRRRTLSTCSALPCYLLQILRMRKSSRSCRRDRMHASTSPSGFIDQTSERKRRYGVDATCRAFYDQT